MDRDMKSETISGSLSCVFIFDSLQGGVRVFISGDDKLMWKTFFLGLSYEDADDGDVSYDDDMDNVSIVVDRDDNASDDSE